MDDDAARLNRWRPDLVERNRRILELRAQGMTLRAIGKEVGRSTERVRQILWLHRWRTERQAQPRKVRNGAETGRCTPAVE